MRQAARQIPPVLLHPLLVDNHFRELRVLPCFLCDTGRDSGLGGVGLVFFVVWVEAGADPAAPAGEGRVNYFGVLIEGHCVLFGGEVGDDGVACEGAGDEGAVAEVGGGEMRFCG